MINALTVKFVNSDSVGHLETQLSHMSGKNYVFLLKLHLSIFISFIL